MPFKKFALVVDTPQEIPIGGYTLAAFLFQRDADEQKRLFAPHNRPSIDVVSTHVGVAGVPGRTFFIAKPIQRRQVVTKAGVVLLGQYHDYAQVSENGYYAESAQALEWGDANRDKYLLRIKSAASRSQVALVTVPSLRFLEFLTPDALERRQDAVPGTIVRVSAPVEDAKPLQARLTGIGAADAQSIPRRREGQALEVAPGSLTTLRPAVCARGAPREPLVNTGDAMMTLVLTIQRNSSRVRRIRQTRPGPLLYQLRRMTMTQAMPSPSSPQPVRSRLMVPFVIRPQLPTRLVCLPLRRDTPRASLASSRSPRDAPPRHEAAYGTGEGQQSCPAALRATPAVAPDEGLSEPSRECLGRTLLLSSPLGPSPQAT